MLESVSLLCADNLLFYDDLLVCVCVCVCVVKLKHTHTHTHTHI